MNDVQLDIKLELDKPPVKIGGARHRSKYPELRGLDSQGPEYRKRYSKIRRLKNAKPKPPQKKLL